MTDHGEADASNSIDVADLRRLTAKIVAAHVSHNAVPTGDVPSFVTQTYAALRDAALGPAAPEEPKPVPAVSIRASIKPDRLVCLEDGKALKMLKRHLATRYDMTPDDYRRKWGLPADYPMIAPNYAKQRSEMAKAIGLGRKPKPVPSQKTGKRKAAQRKTATQDRDSD